MKHYPEKVRKILNALIHDMGESAWLYAKDAQRDFSRNRKLPFEKLLPEAVEFLLHAFTDSCMQEKRYRGHRLFAIDGSDVQIPTNPTAADSYCPGAEVRSDYNLLHLDAVYTLCSHLYADMLVHGKHSFGESPALLKLVDRSTVAGSAIFLVVRQGYM